MRIELPVAASLDSLALLLAVLAGVALFRMRLGVVQTLALTALAGLVLKPAADWLLL